MIHNQRINATPPLIRQVDRFLRERSIGHVTGKYSYFVVSILGLKGGQGRFSTRDENDFVVAGEEVVGNGLADAYESGLVRGLSV